MEMNERCFCFYSSAYKARTVHWCIELETASWVIKDDTIFAFQAELIFMKLQFYSPLTLVLMFCYYEPERYCYGK